MWSFDLTAETCNTGNIQGTVSLQGLTGNATLSRHFVNAFGRTTGTITKSVQLFSDGDYLISGLNEGQYFVGHQANFNPPFSSSLFRWSFLEQKIPMSHRVARRQLT